MCPTRRTPRVSSLKLVRALSSLISGRQNRMSLSRRGQTVMEGKERVAIAENHLIELLPRKERGRLLAICERIELVRGEVLGENGSPTRNVYFPTEGFISLVTSLDGQPVLEVGMVGRE